MSIEIKESIEFIISKRNENISCLEKKLIENTYDEKEIDKLVFDILNDNRQLKILNDCEKIYFETFNKD